MAALPVITYDINSMTEPECSTCILVCLEVNGRGLILIIYLGHRYGAVAGIDI